MRFEVHTTVAAPADRVGQLLTQAQAGPVDADNGWLLHRKTRTRVELIGGPRQFEVRGAQAQARRLEVDPDRHIASMQGGWWYQGEYEAQPDAAGTTRLTYRVVNASSSPDWIVALANRLFVGYRAGMRRGLAELHRELESRLSDPLNSS